MTAVSPQDTFSRSPNATHQSVAGEAILIDLDSGVYYSLNQTGTWLWENLDGRRSVAELAIELAQYCDIPDQVDTVQDDLAELLAELGREKLVIRA